MYLKYKENIGGLFPLLTYRQRDKAKLKANSKSMNKTVLKM